AGRAAESCIPWHGIKDRATVESAALRHQMQPDLGRVVLRLRDDPDVIDLAAVAEVEQVVQTGAVDAVVEVDHLRLAVFEDDFGEADLGAAVLDVHQQARAAAVDVHREVGPAVLAVERFGSGPHANVGRRKRGDDGGGECDGAEIDGRCDAEGRSGTHDDGG